MDTTQPLPPPPRPSSDEPSAGRPEPLYRSPQGERAVAGVASGLAASFGVAPGLVRLAFVLLTFAGGVGLLLYLAAWVIIPERPPHLPPPPVPGGGLRLDSPAAVLGVVLIVVAVSMLLGDIGIWSGSVFWATVLIVVGVLLFRRADNPPPRPSVPAVPATGRPSGPPQPPAAPGYRGPSGTTQPSAAPGYRGPGGTTAAVAPPATPPRPTWSERREERARQRSPLGRFTIALALMVTGVGIWLDQLGVITTDAVGIGAAALLVVGLGLLVGAVWGRARGLILVALLLAPVLLAAEALRFPLTLRAGQRIAAPTTVAELAPEYRLGVGQLDVDLSGLDLSGTSGDVDVAASVGLGDLVVEVPQDVGLAVTSRVGVGEYEVAGEEGQGTDLRHRVVRAGPPGSPTINLDTQVGLGAIEVRVAPGDLSSSTDPSSTVAQAARPGVELELR